jgi:hypothetical protein
MTKQQAIDLLQKDVEKTHAFNSKYAELKAQAINTLLEPEINEPIIKEIPPYNQKIWRIFELYGFDILELNDLMRISIEEIEARIKDNRQIAYRHPKKGYIIYMPAFTYGQKALLEAEYYKFPEI